MAKKAELSELATAVAGEILNERRQAEERAEAILTLLVEEDREPSFDELEFMRIECGWDSRTIKNHRRRVARKVHFQAVAGTTAERAKLDANVEAAQAETKKRLPKIDEQLAQLQSERDALLKNQATLERRQSEVRAALGNLCECLPPSVAADLAARRAHAKQTLGRQANELRIELDQIVAVLNERPGESNYWLSLKMFDRSLVSEGLEGGHRVTHRFAPQWPQKKVELAEKLPAMRAELAELEQRLSDELAAINETAQSYWR